MEIAAALASLHLARPSLTLSRNVNNSSAKFAMNEFSVIAARILYVEDMKICLPT